MNFRQLKHQSQKALCLTFSILLLLASKSPSEKTLAKMANEVTMRKIGHEVLKCLGDDRSRVMPIEKIDNHYKISFESKLGFNPDDIVTTIDRVMRDTQTSSHYFVEVQQCETNALMHSYEMSHSKSMDQIACLGRDLPVDCYSLLVTLVNKSKNSLNSESSTSFSRFINPAMAVFSILGLLGIFWFFIFRKTRSPQRLNHGVESPDLIVIGSYKFDQRNRHLYSGSHKVDLSNKESELLTVLLQFSNTTVSREIILKKVWKDEGDYIGRTLDVFISKLRKKLDTDGNVKIITERGVGYRLVF